MHLGNIEISKGLQKRTDKTDKTPPQVVSSVLSVTPQGTFSFFLSQYEKAYIALIPN
jgi:hypothetical protein